MDNLDLANDLRCISELVRCAAVRADELTSCIRADIDLEVVETDGAKAYASETCAIRYSLEYLATLLKNQSNIIRASGLKDGWENPNRTILDASEDLKKTFGHNKPMLKSSNFPPKTAELQAVRNITTALESFVEIYNTVDKEASEE